MLAFDLGGTRLKYGVVSQGDVTDVGVIPTPRDPLEPMSTVGAPLLAQHGCGAVGLCVPGLVDDGVLVSLPGKHAGLEGTNLRQRLEELFGLPAVVSNDAVAYSLGEAVAGAARGHARAVVVTIGTGVGVGVVESGRPLGSGPLGGGLLGGQIPIAEDSPRPDSSGRRGSIEALCAAPALGEDVPALLAAARREEPHAMAAVQGWRSNLVRALVALAHAHAPSVIVVGGGPLREDDLLLRGVEERVNGCLFGSYRVAIRRAELGDAAALHGVAHLARESLS